MMEEKILDGEFAALRREYECLWKPISNNYENAQVQTNSFKRCHSCDGSIEKGKELGCGLYK